MGEYGESYRYDFYKLKSLMTQEIRNLGVLGVSGLLLCIAAIASIETYYFAAQWGVVSLMVWLYVWWQCWHQRDLNKPSENATLYHDLGPANRLTLLRGFLIAMTAGFILQQYTHLASLWIPAFLYSVAAILDRLDGFVARRTQRASLLGSSLDNTYDALGLFVAPVLAVNLGKVHWSYLILSIAFYIFQIGLASRKARGLPIYDLAPSKLRRTLAGFQMGYVAIALWPPFSANVTSAVGVGFMIPVLLGFLVDWRIVSGRINARSTKKLFSVLQLNSQHYLQPGLRVVFLAASLPLLSSLTLTPLTLLLLCICSLLILLGCGARIAAVGVLLLLALQPMQQDFSPMFIVFLFSTCWIALLGSGRFSLWQGDDIWVERHDGAI